jgi:hypothetical protein
MANKDFSYKNSAGGFCPPAPILMHDANFRADIVIRPTGVRVF